MNIFGGFVEPVVKRNDYIIFSTFEVELNNQHVNGKVFAIGFWDNIIFDDKQTNLSPVNIIPAHVVDPDNGKETNW